MLRQWDNTEDPAQPWRGCANHRKSSSNDCTSFGNRLSGSIVFPEQRQKGGNIPLFSSEPGVVFSPSIGVTCAYSNDGGSRGRDDGCGRTFCPSYRGATDPWCDGLPHAPADVVNALRGSISRGGYNEIIIDSHHLDSTLPGGIEAIFYVKGSRSAKAVDAHANFLAAYAKRGVTKDTFPLVQLDPMNWDNPFDVDAG